MIPPECYWPPEMLAKAMPERYGHLAADDGRTLVALGASPQVNRRAYTVEKTAGGTAIIRPQFCSAGWARIHRGCS